MTSNPTYYDILEVAETASQEAIKGAYKYLSQKWHPDKNPDKDAAFISQALNEAYDVLSDLQRRTAYDEQIKQYDESKCEEPVSAKYQRAVVVVEHPHEGFLQRCALMLIFSACAIVVVVASYQLMLVGVNWVYAAALVFCLAVGWYTYVVLFPPSMVIEQPHE